MRKHAQHDKYVFYDTGIVVLSVLIAILLVRTGALSSFFSSIEGAELLGPFLGGVFFTSIFTTAPAIAALGQVAILQGVLHTALIGAVGGMLGDLVILKVLRDRFEKHLADMLAHKSIWRRYRFIFNKKLFRWVSLCIGGLILASPLPDELGIAILGSSKLRTKYFASISFIFNFLGILFIGLAARALAA